MRPTQLLEAVRHLKRAALTLQESTCRNQQQNKQRYDDRRHDPVDQAKPRQCTLPPSAAGAFVTLGHRSMPWEAQ
jgi:hypothetical protein